MFAPTVSSDGTPSGLRAPSADSAESRDSATRSSVQDGPRLGKASVPSPRGGSWRCGLPGPGASRRRAGCRAARGTGPARRSPGPQVPLTSWHSCLLVGGFG